MWGNLGTLECYLGVFLAALGVMALAAAVLIRRIFRLGKDNRAPRLTAEATVIGRREEQRFYGTKYRGTRAATYFVVFLIKNGLRVELWVSKRTYKRLADGSVGMLTYQGSRFVKFDPIEKRKAK